MRVRDVALWALALACLAPVVAVPEEAKTLTLATTTSVQDSGLLEVLLPPFEKQRQAKVKVVAVGSGQALELAKRGDADVLVVHSPKQEEAFVRDGHGLARRPFMYNYFLIVGPKEDPAKTRGMKSAVSALQAVAKAQAPFVSRGDESGTHVREKELWQKASVQPSGDWYIVGGAGMAATLRLASEKAAYTLTDIATFLAWRDKLALETMVPGDAALQNTYSVIVVSPEAHPGVNAELAGRFADYLFSRQAQKIIADFGKKQYRQPLFYLLTANEQRRQER